MTAVAPQVVDDDGEPVRVAWSPLAGSQVLFVTSPIRETINTGTRGAAKTDGLLMSFAQHVGKGYGPAWRGIVFRRTYPELSDLIERAKLKFGAVFPEARYNSTDHVYTWPGGEALLFRYGWDERDYWSYHGHQYPWVGFEELTSWPNLKLYHAMKSTNRPIAAGVPLAYRANCNPFGVGHNAVKAYLIDPAPAGTIIPGDVPGWDRVRIRSHWSENSALLEADPFYPETILESCKGDTKRARAWLFEDWDVVAGGFFDDVFDRARHVLKPFKIPRTWRIDRSFDWGSSKPFWVGWWAESDGSPAEVDGRLRRFLPGDLVLFAEWYGWNRTPNEGLKLPDSAIAEGILRREKDLGIAGRVLPGPADSSIFDEENGDSPAKIQARHGVRWVKSDKSPGSRVRGWSVLRERLTASEGGARREKPALFVVETCTDGWLRTVPMLPRHHIKPDDVDSEAEDHAGDGTRYRLVAPRSDTGTSTLKL